MTKNTGDNAKDVVEMICQTLYDKKATDIVTLDVADKTIIADYFIVCSGRNIQLAKTLSDEVEQKMAAEGVPLRRKEGYAEGRWIVQDYGDILLHIFHPEERAYYNMERLWQDDDNYFNYSESKGEA